GWHVPTDAEWKTLEKKLGMEQAQADATGYRGTNEGYKLKSTTYWKNDGNGDNSSGFNAKPAGYRYTSGTLNYVGSNGYWWSSSSDGPDAWRRYLPYFNSNVYRNTISQANGYSVRCLAGT
ncbi:MAG: FISUMP domain-containing protein, partial [Bacilli bacterium]|nr:FISUMP domain-containing protein [Bacilli bacterium]